jgi:phosphatidyl-myo-inositol dimannoside synthase
VVYPVRISDVTQSATFEVRVLVLSPDPKSTGGIQRVSRTLMRALVERFGTDRVGSVALFDAGDIDSLPCRELWAGSHADGVAHVRFVEQMRFLLKAVGAAWRWRRRLVIICCYPQLAPVAWACGIVARAPFAVWGHGIEVWGPVDPWTRFGLRRANLLFAPSFFTAGKMAELAGIAEGAVRVIPHCLSPEILVSPPRAVDRPPGMTVLTVSRLSPLEGYKGVDVLLKAWPDVLFSLRPARLLVVGAGPDRLRLEQLARELGVHQSVQFLGRVSDRELGRLYEDVDVFALPARFNLTPKPEGEGFGLVYVEAGAHGLPVVAGFGGGAAEVVVDGETGLLVEPRDPTDVAKAVVRLLADPSLARSMGEAGRVRASTMSSYSAFSAAAVDLVLELGETGRRRTASGYC